MSCCLSGNEIKNVPSFRRRTSYLHLIIYLLNHDHSLTYSRYLIHSSFVRLPIYSFILSFIFHFLSFLQWKIYHYHPHLLKMHLNSAHSSYLSLVCQYNATDWALFIILTNYINIHHFLLFQSLIIQIKTCTNCTCDTIHSRYAYFEKPWNLNIISLLVTTCWNSRLKKGKYFKRDLWAIYYIHMFI